MIGASGQVFAAVKAVDITPPIGVKLEGYGARKEPSNDIHDPLYATLLVLKNSHSGVGIVACDLLAVSLRFTRVIRAALAPLLEIPEQNILVSATHTHSGPAGILGRMPPLTSEEDPFLQDTVVRKLAGAARWANRNIEPARLGTGSGRVSEVGRNRNDPTGGLADDEVIVLRVDNVAGQPLALLVSYGCHPTVLGPDNLAVSADFPGSARAALGKIFPGMGFLFLNGATGDVSTRFTRRGQGFTEVERMGQILAGEVLKVMHSAVPVEAPVLSGCTRQVRLPFRHFPSIQAAQRHLEALQAELHRVQAEPSAPGFVHGNVRKAVTKVEGAQAQLILAEAFAGLTGIDTEIQALRIGPMAILGMPGEPFTKTVLGIKEHSPVHPVVIASYANDYCGYFPDAGSVAAGTYEALTSPYDAAVADYLAGEALALIS